MTTKTNEVTTVKAVKVTSQILTDAVRADGIDCVIRTRSGKANGGFSAASGFPAGSPGAAVLDGVSVDTVEVASECLLHQQAWTDRAVVGIVRAYVDILFPSLRADGADATEVAKSTGFVFKKSVGWILPRGPKAIRAFIKAHRPNSGMSANAVKPRGLRILCDTKDVLLGAVAVCRDVWSVVLDAETPEEFAAAIEANRKGKEDAAAEREAAAAQREKDGVATFSAHISVALHTAIMARVTAMDLDASNPRDRGLALEAIAGIADDEGEGAASVLMETFLGDAERDDAITAKEAVVQARVKEEILAKAAKLQAAG